MTQPLTPQTLVYGLTRAGDPQISPDGSRILYTLTKNDKEAKKARAHLWLCARDGSNAHQLTFAGEQEGNGRWSPDGSQIVFTSDRVAKPAKTGIFVLPAGVPGDPRELTKHNQGIADLAWSPDGKTIAYITSFDPENPDEEEQKPDEPARVRVTRRYDYKFDARGYLGNARNQVWLVDVESGERRRLTDEPLDHGQPRWSPDGKTLATRVADEDGSWLELIDVATGATRRTGAEGEHQEVGVWAWSPSSDRLLYSGDPEHTYWPDFYVYDLANGESHRLAGELPALPSGGMPVWLDERQVLFAASRAGGSGLWTLDSESGATEQLVWSPASKMGLSVDASKRYVVQAHSSFETTGEISVDDIQGNETEIVTDYNAELLSRAGTPEWERFEVERVGYTIEAWLLKPPGFDPAKRYPLVLDIHGGPNGFYGYSFVGWQQCLASNGYVVVASNPRGSNSYGREFTMQVFSDWGGEDFKDLMAVADAAIERPYVDPKRTGIIGGSYGGYMTSWIIGQTDRFKACVCIAPVFDLESFYGTSDIGYRFGERQFGGRPHEISEWYAAHSPSTFAHRATTPTLIMHGESDLRCPIGQGEQMFVALKKAGCPTEFVRYPGGTHSAVVMGPLPHQEDFLTRMLAWFKQYLGEPM